MIFKPSNRMVDGSPVQVFNMITGEEIKGTINDEGADFAHKSMIARLLIDGDIEIVEPEEIKPTTKEEK